MIRKRSAVDDICRIKRKSTNHYGTSNPGGSHPTDTRGALHYLTSIFPKEKFRGNLPPIVLKHQLYALVKNRTEVDKCLNDMRRSGEVRLIKLEDRENQVAVVYSDNYRDHLLKHCKNFQTAELFMNKVVLKCPDISYTVSVLHGYGISENDISLLRQDGVLTCRDVRCYWLSIPGVSMFKKAFNYGTNRTLQFIRRTKYKEILKSELEKRKLPKPALLGILYHMYDLIGSDVVSCIDTSTDVMLRLVPNT